MKNRLFLRMVSNERASVEGLILFTILAVVSIVYLIITKLWTFGIFAALSMGLVTAILRGRRIIKRQSKGK